MMIKIEEVFIMDIIIARAKANLKNMIIYKKDIVIKNLMKRIIRIIKYNS